MLKDEFCTREPLAGVILRSALFLLLSLGVIKLLLIV